MLLYAAIRKARIGLPQAKVICGSLLCFVARYFIASYFYLFQAPLTEDAFASELVFILPQDWSYYLAIIGEPTFMMLAISTMLNALQRRRRAAVDKAQALGLDMLAAETRHTETLKATGARIQAVETSLLERSDEGSTLSAEQRFVAGATEIVLKHLTEDGAGRASWRRLWP